MQIRKTKKKKKYDGALSSASIIRGYRGDRLFTAARMQRYDDDAFKQQHEILSISTAPDRRRNAVCVI